MLYSSLRMKVMEFLHLSLLKRKGVDIFVSLQEMKLCNWNKKNLMTVLNGPVMEFLFAILKIAFTVRDQN